MTKYDNNFVMLQGTIVGWDDAADKNCLESNSLSLWLSIKRESDCCDKVRVCIPDKLYTSALERVKRISVEGKLLTKNIHYNGKSYLVVYVLATKIYTDNIADTDINHVSLGATICKEPTYRMTPKSHKKISDLTLANNTYIRSSYIPTIAWQGAAFFIAHFGVGTYVFLEGRLQSREYPKNGQLYTTYELSVDRFAHVEGKRVRDTVEPTSYKYIVKEEGVTA